jgi:hypothetical protein
MWLNLKELSWEAHSKPVANPPTAVKEQQFKKVSYSTLGGMHVLGVLWMKCDELAARTSVGVECGKDETRAAPKVQHVYVQPSKDKELPKTGNGVGPGPTKAPWWLHQIETWAKQFGKIAKDPLVRDVFIEVPSGGGVVKRMEAQLLVDTFFTISSDNNFSPRTVTGAYEDGSIAFQEQIYYDKNDADSRIHFNNTPGALAGIAWGAKQSHDRKAFSLLMNGQRLMHVKDAHQIDLFKSSNGSWELKNTVRTNLPSAAVVDEDLAVEEVVAAPVPRV